jgi:hypothetical protein
VSSLRIVVSGMVAGQGQGGAAWAVLQYVLGLRRLGHDVWLVEPVDALTASRVRTLDAIAAEFGLEGRAALVCDGHAAGLPYASVRSASRGADLLLNISGMLADSELLEHASLRVWLDLDPCFNQHWHLQGLDMRFDGHDRFVTVGQRIGLPGCDVPTCGRDWLRTLPPVVLDQWPVGLEIAYDGLTTVGNWRAYGSVEHEGRRLGQKAHSVRALLELPELTPERIMPALSIHPEERADLAALDRHGWHVLDPVALTATPSAYRSFLRSSKGELGIAKEGYVLSRCGWFSDRSACYLAAGRPVVAQDTGFGLALPTGEGLLTFDTALGAAAAIERMRADSRRHAHAARALAETYLDSDRVLSDLLDAL